MHQIQLFHFLISLYPCVQLMTLSHTILIKLENTRVGTFCSYHPTTSAPNFWFLPPSANEKLSTLLLLILPGSWLFLLQHCVSLHYQIILWGIDVCHPCTPVATT